MAKKLNITHSRLTGSDILVDPSKNARTLTDKGYDREGSLKAPEGTTIASLARSIKGDGLLQALIVKELTAAEQKETGKSHILAGGFRRMMAIETIKDFGPIPVAILPHDASAADVVAAGIAENMQRVDLTPAEKANSLWMLREAIKEDTGAYPSYNELAKRCHMSKAYANHLCKLKERLCPQVWEQFETGHEAATVMVLVQRVMGFDDPAAQWEAWLMASGQKTDNTGGEGDGDGGEGGEGPGDGGGEVDAPPKRATGKQLQRAIRGLKLHRGGSRAKSEDYYKSAMAWLKWAMDTNGKAPLSLDKLLDDADAAAAETEE